jgi:single-strand DNA-binding protein
MFDTMVTIVGNALNVPEWRRVQGGDTLVASFRVASSSRRFDKDTGRWVDRPGLRVRVTCWRRLAAGVASSVMVGDPLIVTGRLYTRDWQTEDGQKRVSYELEAVAVGHDLSRGQASFTRTRLNASTSAVEDPAAEARIRGEVAEPVRVSVAAPGAVDGERDAGAPLREARLAAEGIAGFGPFTPPPVPEADPFGGDPFGSDPLGGDPLGSDPFDEPAPADPASGDDEEVDAVQLDAVQLDAELTRGTDASRTDASRTDAQGTGVGGDPAAGPPAASAGNGAGGAERSAGERAPEVDGRSPRPRPARGRVRVPAGV